MTNIIVDTNYPMYDDIQFGNFSYLLSKQDIETSLKQTLRELDCTKLYKGKLIYTIHTTQYEQNVNLYIRLLLRLTDYHLYNTYFSALQEQHQINIKFEEEFKLKDNIAKEVKKKKQKVTKYPNKYIKHETINLYTGKIEYIYDNLYTGDSFTSDNPDLLPELNERKTKRNKVKTLPIVGKVIFDFKRKPNGKV